MSVNGINTERAANAEYSRRSNSAGSTGGSGFAGVLNDRLSASSVDLDGLFEAASVKYGVPVSLLKAVAKAESNFDSSATSSCGAMGIMQLMPFTAESLGVSDAYDPEQNIMGGAKFLSRLLSEFDGNTELAVAAYNAGPGNVIKYGGIPPFKETQSYVAKVMAYCGSELTAGTVQAKAGSSEAAPADTASAEAASDPRDDMLSCIFHCDAESFARLTLIRMQMRLLDLNRDKDDENKFAL